MSRTIRGRVSGRWAMLAACLVVSGGAVTCAKDEPPPAEMPCQDDEETFVQRASLALTGRLLEGAGERAVWADALRSLKAQGHSQQAARAIVARAMMQGKSYEDRWFDAIIDMLRVPRHPTAHNGTWEGVVAIPRCYSEPVEVVTRDIAVYVRDNGPLSTEPPRAKFTMGNLLRSSLMLDDLSPVYRAHLLFFISIPISGANVSADALELERRRAFGLTFETAYVNRDPSCLTCHNSEFTVAPTNPLGALRFYPVHGFLEAAVYGDSAATADREEYHAMFRHRDVVVPDDCATEGCGVGERIVPWNWDPTRCGALRQLDAPDPLGVKAHFGSVGSTAESPTRGLYTTVFQLEGALRRGFDELRALGGEVAAADGTVDDPDVAFAYLVSLTIAEKVWAEVMGRPLTISHHFPRTRAQRDLLAHLAKVFVTSGYSLKSLLAEIVSHPAFNQLLPRAGCGDEYPLPAVFDPFSIDRDNRSTNNSVGDAQHSLPTRLVRSALHQAMGWKPPPRFPPPTGDEQTFQVATGYFNSREAPGFRGLDFQSRLIWESRYHHCGEVGQHDLLAQLIEHGTSKSASVESVIVALRDRLTAEGPISDEIERQVLSEIIGRGLDTPIVSEDEDALRLICGAMVASPQLMLGGPVISARSPGNAALALPGSDYGSWCPVVANAFNNIAVGAGCGPGGAIELQP